MINSRYPFNNVPAPIPEAINSIRTELKEKIKETIFENFGPNISRGELESLMNSFSSIIQRQVNEYVRQLNNLSQSINYAPYSNQYCPNSIPLNEYSPMMSNNFIQNSQYDDINSLVKSTIYGSNYENRNNYRNNQTFKKPKSTKLRKSNFRKKRQNLSKTSKQNLPIEKTTEPIKQAKTSSIQINEQTKKQFEPIQKPINQTQKIEPIQNQTETNQKQNEQIQKPIEPIQSQLKPIPQQPTITYTIESFNDLSLTDQQLALLSISLNS